MIWRIFLDGLVRTRLLNQATLRVLLDIQTNNLSAADNAIIDSYLDETMPPATP
ncbi:hypothetical protein [Roseovarius Plymouth podovirus 1]|uniref:Uncharacterized protein n=2 Tax=Roseovarius Plymouth podovirus 1 TaxID=926474 RepID=K4Q598_9CAUD|nr:hypothetical protein HYO70_gp47 [Roseovarius Plymouth podovirus 1]CBW47040.1 hypothetical protein [Roseovarius sp. 217 phage 1]CBX87977.1 hypothetical protein [Roseovarius Plymouth podovirus 1]